MFRTSFRKLTARGLSALASPAHQRHGIQTLREPVHVPTAAKHHLASVNSTVCSLPALSHGTQVLGSIPPSYASLYQIQRPPYTYAYVRTRDHQTLSSQSHLKPCTRNCSTSATPRMSSASAAPNPSQPQVDYRLPTDIKPTHYDLTVRTDLKESKFDGVVKIECVPYYEHPALRANTTVHDR